MLIGIKDILKLFGITVVSACAVFVCTLFLNYNIDLVSVGETISGEAGRTMYEAVVSMGKITAAVSGGCLVLTAVAMLVFYIKNFVDAHGKELGILKALGYSSPEIAKHFCVFGLSVFFGCLIGFVAAFLYLPRFYSLNNSEGLFPDIPVTFHPLLAVLLICIPTLFFSALSVLFALMRLRTSAIDMIREKNEVRSKVCV
ncbi:MAG: FtsX-like permease family protein [Clostridiales bacterium]|nr:FtsX-like permease family protein [Clostridiales bacterium]